MGGNTSEANCIKLSPPIVPEMNGIKESPPASLEEKVWEDELCFMGNEPARIDSRLMTKLPHRLIGLITFENANGCLGVGTGILISRNLVLTVAHNVFDHSFKKYYRKHRFYRGICGKVDTYYSVESFFMPEMYKKKRGPQYDYALLKLDRNTDVFNFISLNGKLPQLSQKEEAGIFGYNKTNKNWKSLDPKDMYQFQAYQSGVQLKTVDCLDASQNKEFLNHKISTLAGASGAPIILFGNDDTISIIGIHKGGDKDRNSNIGKRITPKFIKQLQDEAAKLKAEPFQFQNAQLPKQFVSS